MTDINTTQTPPAAPVSATQPVDIRYRIGFTLASIVPGISSVALKQLMEPLQVRQLDPLHPALSLAWVASVGALAGLIVVVLAGALSDYTRLRLGRRRPWIAGGILVCVLGLGLMAAARTIFGLLLGGVIEQCGAVTVLATVTVLIPDHVPVPQHAHLSALNGMAPMLGGVVGLVLVTSLTNTKVVAQGYLVLAVLSVLCVIVFLAVLHERPRTDETLPVWHGPTFVRSLLHPLSSRHFTLTLLSRLLVFTPYTLLGTFLLYYLLSAFHVSAPVAAQRVTLFQVVLTLCLTLAALLVGAWSARVKRLKPFMIGGTLVMALALVVLIVLPTWTALFAAAALFGTGFGAYAAGDIHLAVRVLPRASERGKGIGIIHSAIYLPLVIGPWIGAGALNLASSFPLLFTVAALACVAAAGLIVPIRAVR
jgi:MFS family permease